VERCLACEADKRPATVVTRWVEWSARRERSYRRSSQGSDRLGLTWHHPWITNLYTGIQELWRCQISPSRVPLIR
jgi:hypothetical protein